MWVPFHFFSSFSIILWSGAKLETPVKPITFLSTLIWLIIIRLYNIYVSRVSKQKKFSHVKTAVKTIRTFTALLDIPPLICQFCKLLIVASDWYFFFYNIQSGGWETEGFGKSLYLWAGKWWSLLRDVVFHIIMKKNPLITFPNKIIKDLNNICL